MPRLVSADFFPGRLLKIDSVVHRVIGLKDKGATVLLRRDDTADTGVEPIHVVPRAELCAKIVEETAFLIDDIEDPDIATNQPEIDLSVLSIDRKLDWYHKMIVIRGVLAYSKMSPRSAQFKAACERARQLLRWVRVNSDARRAKSWADKTLNDDLRRWRRAGYALAALQVKGLQYRPAPTKPHKHVTATKLIEQIRSKHPLWRIEAVRRMCEYLLRNGISSYPDGPAGASEAQRMMEGIQ